MAIMHEIKLQNTQIEYQLLSPRPNQRRVIFRMEDGVLTVRAPKWLKRSEIESVIRQNEAWIFQQRAMKRSVTQHSLSIGDTIFVRGESWTLVGTDLVGTDKEKNRGPLFSDELGKRLFIPSDAYEDVHSLVYAWLRSEASVSLRQMTRNLASKHACLPNRIVVKEQARRWGSCSTLGNINLNWRLIQAPVEVQQYVIIHELAHLTEMNHSKEFWTLVKRMMPRYENSKTWLRTHGEQLHFLQPTFVRR